LTDDQTAFIMGPLKASAAGRDQTYTVQVMLC
jgi:hypothetical protein